jgi:hypothetical protein
MAARQSPPENDNEKNNEYKDDDAKQDSLLIHSGRLLNKQESCKERRKENCVLPNHLLQSTGCSVNRGLRCTKLHYAMSTN